MPKKRHNKKDNMLKALIPSLTNFTARAFSWVLALALAAIATAQNLVVNPGFEDTVNCELTTQCTLLKAAHWYNPTLCTPDVYDCDLDRLCGMGMSDEGGFNLSYQYAYEGTRHAGAYYWFGPGSSNTREYLGTRLSEPLVAGHLYEVSCYESRCRNFQYAIDHIGAWLGPDSLWQNTTWWLAQTPQLRLRDPDSEYLVEGENWVRVSDTIVAAGGEQWLVMGNFDVADSVNGILAEPGGVNEPAYYYIDEVAVVDIGGTAGIADAGLVTHWSAGSLIASWPPGFKPVMAMVFDPHGRLVQHQGIVPSALQQAMYLEALSSGVYILHITNGHQRMVTKFVKEEGGL